MSERRKTPPYVPAGDCLKAHVIIDERLHKFDLALFGEDGCHGLVETINGVKTDITVIKSATGLVRQILVPTIASLLTAGLMFLLLRS